MGTIDIEGKQYLSNKKIFADAFNYLIYDGEPVIKPDELEEIDTTEFAVPYGDKNVKAPVQKYRDILKVWNAMVDDTAMYVLLGVEIQDKVHYGMPIKSGLYDMLGYSKQIEELKRKNRELAKNKDSEGRSIDEGELVVENGVMKIKLTSEEFLSGLCKGDKLKPIITAVIYLGEEAWDGPRSLFDMLDVRDDKIYDLISNYKLNLISPIYMTDDDFEKFNTDFGLAMKILKHHKTDAVEVIQNVGNGRFDRDTAEFVNKITGLQLEFKAKGDEIDMFTSVIEHDKKMKVLGAITAFRSYGLSENEIITKIMECFDVTKEYVLELIEPEKA